MSNFSPSAIFERGRQEMAANQPRFYERLRELIANGLAICLEHADGSHQWLACAPGSRLEPGLFVAQDLAMPGAAGEHRIQFEQIGFTQDTWGWLLVAGSPVADFRPLSEAEEQKFVDLWNERSGQPPIRLVDF